MILVGYCEDSKAYRLINLEEHSGKVHKGRDVDFIEIPEISYQKIDKIQEETEINPLCKQEDEIQEEEFSESEEEENQEQETSQEESLEWEDAEDTIDDVQEDRRYLLRIRKPKEFPDMIIYQAIYGDSADSEPLTLEETLNRKNGQKVERSYAK